MSGTSADLIDCAALDLSSEEIKVLSCKNSEIPKNLKKDIIQSSQSEKIEQKLVDDFTKIIGNFCLIHVNDEYPKSTKFDK